MKKENINILLIMAALFSGGAEKQYRIIMESLMDNGFCVSVLLLNESVEGQKEKEQEYILNHNGINFIRLHGQAVNAEKKGKLRGKYEKLKSLFRQRILLKTYLRDYHVDIVMFSYITQLLMVSLFRKFGVKTIYNERNTGRQVCNKRFKLKLLRSCDKVISNSKYSARYIEEHSGVHVEVINNGIKIENIKKRSHTGYNIIVPARINRIKNQLVVIQALNIIQNKDNIFDIKLTLAGGVEDETYLNQIVEMINNNHLEVIITGFVDDMRSLYEDSDLVILPSYEEGTPNVLLEAYMYSITPLISDIPMNRDCCFEKNLLFNPNNPEELARKIECQINKNIDIDNLFIYRERLNYVKTNFNIESMSKKYMNLFLNLMKE